VFITGWFYVGTEGKDLQARYKKPTARNVIFLRKWREAAHLTQRVMAAKLGLSVSVLSKVENGKVPYHQDVLEMYAAVLGVETGDLLGPPDQEKAALLHLWARLSPEGRRRAMAHVETVARDDTRDDENSHGNPGPAGMLVRMVPLLLALTLPCVCCEEWLCHIPEIAGHFI
jgi:transcriptional regulator with XRE-family HTH domain